MEEKRITKSCHFEWSIMKIVGSFGVQGRNKSQNLSLFKITRIEDALQREKRKKAVSHIRDLAC